MAGGGPPPGLIPGLYLAVLGTDKRVRITHASGAEREWALVPPTPVDIVSAPALVQFHGVLFLFALGANRKVHYNIQIGSGLWTGWVALSDGDVQDQPSAVVFKNTLYLFARGTDNRMFYRTLTHVWSGWQEVHGNGQTSSGLNATLVGGEVQLFVRGTDNRVYTSIFLGPSAAPTWTELPDRALITATPGVAAYDRSLFVVVRGATDGVHAHFRNGEGKWQGWPAWSELPGGARTQHNPIAAIHGPEVHVYLLGVDGKLYRNRGKAHPAAPNEWSGWTPIPSAGTLAAAPAAAVI